MKKSENLVSMLRSRLQTVERNIINFDDNKQMYASPAKFEAWLDDTQPTVTVMGYAFKPSVVLFQANYEGYMDELRNWANNLDLTDFDEYNQLIDEREQLQVWLSEL
jgi:hypothetical protein